MTWPAWLNRVLPYLGRRQARQDLQEELRLHMEFERERQRDAGATETEARRSARRRLGSIVVIREDVDAVWGWRWLDDLGRDLRHAVRGLRRNPGVTATIIIVLAMGIGANTAMFSIVHGMLLRELPYPDADAIVRIGESYGADAGWSPNLSNRSMLALQEEAESFEQLAAYGPAGPVVSAGRRGSVTLRGARVSPALFPLLRAAPHVGRLFTEGEARAGADRVALLSFDAWNIHFASDPDIVGAVLRQDGGPLTHAVPVFGLEHAALAHRPVDFLDGQEDFRALHVTPRPSGRRCRRGTLGRASANRSSIRPSCPPRCRGCRRARSARSGARVRSESDQRHSVWPACAGGNPRRR